MSCYLYAVAGRVPDGALAGVRGVAGEPVACLAEPADGHGLTAVVGEVPAEEFGERALRAGLEDLDRLEALARAHHGVVDAVAAHTTVLPLRLATVYRDAERVREVLRERAAEFRSALERLDGRAEWGVKVYASPSPAPVAAVAPSPGGGRPGTGEPGGAGERTGRSYLRQRLAERRQREDGLRRAAGLGQRVDRELRALADDVRLHRPQDPRLSGVPGENVLNAAYLVPRERVDAFRARAAELAAAEPSARLELTGPWAPYSFAVAEAPARAGGAT